MPREPASPGQPRSAPRAVLPRRRTGTWPRQLRPVERGAGGPDHRLAIVVGLPEPKPLARDRQRAGPAPVVVGHRLVAGEGGRDHRVQHRDRPDAKEERDRHRRQQRCPDGPPRGPRHDQLGRAGKRQEQEDRRDDRDERQDAVERFRHVEDGERQEPPEAHPPVAEAADLLEQVEERQDQEERPQHREEGPEIAAREVEVEPHAGTLRTRRRRRPGRAASHNSSAAAPSPSRVGR
jgi:hypothetical protein